VQCSSLKLLQRQLNRIIVTFFIQIGSPLMLLVVFLPPSTSQLFKLFDEMLESLQFTTTTTTQR